MDAAAGQRVRVLLKWVQVLDDQDPAWKGAGEFRFFVRVTGDGVVRERWVPEAGVLEISDDPRRNRVRLDLPIFEGVVRERLEIELAGVELDVGDAHDALPGYRRVFTGPPAGWLGSYGPGDEEEEPEDLGAWRVWYRIEAA